MQQKLITIITLVTTTTTTAAAIILTITIAKAAIAITIAIIAVAIIAELTIVITVNAKAVAASVATTIKVLALANGIATIVRVIVASRFEVILSWDKGYSALNQSRNFNCLYNFKIKSKIIWINGTQLMSNSHCSAFSNPKYQNLNQNLSDSFKNLHRCSID